MLSEEDFIKSIKQWSVFYFVNEEVHSLIPHYFIIINKNISTSPVLVIPVSTTKINKRKAYYKKHWFSEETLVEVKPEETNWILKKDSVFDCSQTKIMDPIKFFTLYQKKKLKYIGIIPLDILNKLRIWVTSTNQIANWIKNLV